MAALLVAGALAAACGGDGDEEAVSTTAIERTTTTLERTTTTARRTTTTAEPTTSTAAPTTTPTTVALDTPEAVLRDYRAGWDGVNAAFDAEPPNPDDPVLLDLYRDPALASTQDVVRRILSEGTRVRGEAELDPVVASILGSEAVVHDCVVDLSETFDPATSAVVSPATPEPVGLDYRLRLEGERWRTYDVIEREASCAGR